MLYLAGETAEQAVLPVKIFSLHYPYWKLKKDYLYIFIFNSTWIQSKFNANLK